MAKSLSAAEAAQHILQAAQRGEEIVSVLGVESNAAGARMIVWRDATVEGTFGTEQLDKTAIALALTVFSTGEPALSGGIFAEPHFPAEQLVIFGAGHIAVPLAELGTKLGFQVIVLDDRSDFASQERFAATVGVRLLDPDAPLAGLRIDTLTSIVLVTRAHQYDFELLRAIVNADAQPRYIGMIGSRRRVRAAFTALLEAGVPRAKLEGVHAPIGLDIGAETPAEIAVSIAAELIRVRRSGTARALSDEERVLDRFFMEPPA